MKKTNEKVVGSKAAANMVASNVANHENAIRVMVFECSEFGCIRILTDEKGEPQFCGNDVCKALGYDQARKAILRHVKPTDGTKRTASVTIRRNGSVYEQKRSLHFVNESGFYALVLGSKLPTAQRFKHWVTSVVLPQIRKTGGFIPLHEGESDEAVVRKTEEILRKTLREKNSFIAQQNKLIREQKVLLGKKNRQTDSRAGCGNRPAAAQGSLRRQRARKYLVLHHHADSQGTGHDGAGTEPLALRRTYTVLPERTVYALCRLCPPRTGEEPNPL